MIATTVIAAVARSDIATFVDNLFLVYIILVICSVAISWVVNIRGALPYTAPLRAFTGFVEQTTSPYLNTFRRFLPSARVGGLALDLSPMIGLIVLFVMQAIVVGLIRG